MMASLIGAFTHTKKVTVDTGTASIGALTDFPVCIAVNSTSWSNATERGHFFDASNTNGKRVQFFAADQTTNLAYEVESYDGTGQTAVYWVKATLGASATDIYAAYGNDPNSSDQDQATTVWDSSYKAVYHLGTGLTDSTGVNNLTSSGSSDAAGVAARGRDFDGTDDYCFAADNASLDIAGDFTVELWANLDNAITGDTSGHYPGLIEKGTASYPTRNYGIYGYQTNGYLYAEAGNGGTETHHVTVGVASADTYLGTGAFRHIAFVNDDTIRADIYIDATSRGNSTTYNGTQATNSGSIWVGSLGEAANPNYKFNGKIDEVRISAIARSAQWVKATYYSINATSYNGDGWLTWSAEGGSTSLAPYFDYYYRRRSA